MGLAIVVVAFSEVLAFCFSDVFMCPLFRCLLKGVPLRGVTVCLFIYGCYLCASQIDSSCPFVTLRASFCPLSLGRVVFGHFLG